MRQSLFVRRSAGAIGYQNRPISPADDRAVLIFGSGSAKELDAVGGLEQNQLHAGNGRNRFFIAFVQHIDRKL